MIIKSIHLIQREEIYKILSKALVKEHHGYCESWSTNHLLASTESYIFSNRKKRIQTCSVVSMTFIMTFLVLLKRVLYSLWMNNFWRKLFLFLSPCFGRSRKFAGHMPSCRTLPCCNQAGLYGVFSGETPTPTPHVLHLPLVCRKTLPS